MGALDQLDLQPGLAELLAPVADLVDRGLSALAPHRLRGVRFGVVDGFFELADGVVVLSDGLAGPALRHPHEEGDPLGLDRWRRSAASVLEGAAITAFASALGVEAGSDWRWTGAAIDRVDRLVPELGLAARDLGLAVRTGAPGEFARAGIGALRGLLATAAVTEIDDLLTGSGPTPAQWLRAGVWVFDATSGPSLPVDLERPPWVAPPAAVPAWSWCRVGLRHPRGGRLVPGPGGAVQHPWAVARRAHRTVAAATSRPTTLTLQSGGPVGDWDLASAAGFGQFFGGRGVQYSFREDGAMEVTLADSFVGTVDAVEVSRTVGTSGLVTGRWEVAGERRLRLRGLDPSMLTLHGREAGGFAVPAQGFGPSQWLPALCAEPWSWSLEGSRLVMKGRMFGAPVEVRLDQSG